VVPIALTGAGLLLVIAGAVALARQPRMATA
jgi:hypothetical protein